MKPDRDGDKRGGDFVRQNETFLVKIGTDAANNQFRARTHARGKDSNSVRPKPLAVILLKPQCISTKCDRAKINAASAASHLAPSSSYGLFGAALYPVWIASCSVMYLPFLVVP
jgi:hypothetical protein